MIPQSNPKANYLAHRAEITAAITEVLDSGWYILGQHVKTFEQEFATYLGVTHALGVANGTDALHLAIRASGLGPGDAIVTVSNTAVATVAAIELAGATPILVDVDPTTFTLDPNHLEATLKHYTAHPIAGVRLRGVIPVHLYGHPADLPAILALAQQYDLHVIEDCAQAHGARLHGRRVGQWAPIAAFSFYPTKNLGALGDGGAIATTDATLAENVRLLREYGWRERYISQIGGLNSRLDELQAALLSVKLRYLDAENARRRAIAALYTQHLADASVTRPATASGAEHVYHQYVVQTPERDALKTHLAAQGISTLIHYPVPIHQQPAYQTTAVLGPGGLPQTERLSREILSLPMHPELTDEQVVTVAQAIRTL